MPKRWRQQRVAASVRDNSKFSNNHSLRYAKAPDGYPCHRSIHPMHAHTYIVTELNFVHYDGLPVDTSEQLDAFLGNGRVWTEVKQGNILNKLFWEGGGAPADVFLVTASAQVTIQVQF